MEDLEPVIRVLFAWLAFGGSHIALASSPVRGPLAARLGEKAFQGLFSAVAVATFALLCSVYADASTRGPAGLALASNPWIRWPAMATSALGVVSVFASLFDYPSSAYALSSAGHKREPRGFERITRHGFAVGIAMVGAAHALLAAQLSGTVFFAALALFAIAGSVHQDAKLRARDPERHGAFLAQTSLVPFAAIVSGRGRLVMSELRGSALALGLVAAWALREAHPWIFARGGVYVVIAVVGGAALATVQDARRMRRRRRRSAAGRGSISPRTS